MPEYVIERDLPGLSELNEFQQAQAIRRSCSTLHGVAPDVAWIRTYLTSNKVYCVFRAPSEEVLRDLMEQWDLPPALSISEVSEVIEPGVER